MSQFQALALGVEVNGAAIQSIIEGMRSFRAMALHILASQGIDDPETSKWYPQQAWLDAFKEISANMGMSTLKTIGRRIPEVALWPKEVNTVDKALASIDVAYHMNHRGGEIGHYHYKKNDESLWTIVCDNPYPCDFDAGIIEATAKKFAPKGTPIFVTHTDLMGCRKKGSESCTYVVRMF